MSTKAKPNPRLALLIEPENMEPGSREGFCHLNGRIVYAPADWNGEIEHPYEYGPEADLSYCNLRLRSQGANAERTSLYAYSWSYRDLWEVDLRRGEMMVKLLKQLERGLERANQDDGWYQSFGQYVLRSCKALGIKVILYKNERIIANKYRQMNLSEGASFIDSLVSRWRQDEESRQRLNEPRSCAPARSELVEVPA